MQRKTQRTNRVSWDHGSPRVFYSLFLPINRCRLVWMLMKLEVVDPWLAPASQSWTTPLCGLRFRLQHCRRPGPSPPLPGTGWHLESPGRFCTFQLPLETSAQQSSLCCLPGLRPHFCQEGLDSEGNLDSARGPCSSGSSTGALRPRPSSSCAVRPGDCEGQRAGAGSPKNQVDHDSALQMLSSQAAGPRPAVCS